MLARNESFIRCLIYSMRRDKIGTYLGWQINGQSQTGPFSVALLQLIPLGEVLLARQPLSINKVVIENER
jgi:hypothetical protein